MGVNNVKYVLPLVGANDAQENFVYFVSVLLGELYVLHHLAGVLLLDYERGFKLLHLLGNLQQADSVLPSNLVEKRRHIVKHTLLVRYLPIVKPPMPIAET